MRSAGSLGLPPGSVLAQAQAGLSYIQNLWNQINARSAQLGNGNPCRGYGNASDAGNLQTISTQACTIAHQAAQAALGFAVQCGNRNGSSQNALNASNATVAACTLGEQCTFQATAQGDSLGTLTIDVNGGTVTCMDRSYHDCVGQQLAAAAYAVQQAALAQQACLQRPAPVILNPQPGPVYLPPARPMPTLGPIPILRAGVGRPPVGFGDPSGAINAGVSNVFQGLCPTGETAQQCLASGIGQYCPPGQGTACSNAIAAYQSIGPSASNAMSAFASGNTVGGIEACIPLIGMAVSVSPAGPVAGAVVVGGLDLAIDVLQALGLFNSTPQPAASCNYVIWPTMPYWGKNALPGVCFSNPGQPPGPIDPNGNTFAGWLTMEQFMSGSSAQLGPNTASWSSVTSNNGSLTSNSDPTLDINGNPDSTWADVAFGWFSNLRSTLQACGVTMIEVRGQSPPALGVATPQSLSPLINPTSFSQMTAGTQPNAAAAVPGISSSYTGTAEDLVMNVGGFISAYCQTFIRAVCERIINNHNPVDPLVLLSSCQAAWNASHSGSAVYVFGTGQSGVTPYNFVESVIQGQIALPPQSFGQTPQGNEGWPVGINVGPAIVPSGSGGSGGSGGAGAAASSSSGTSTALLVVGGLAAVGAGGVYLYGRRRGMSFGQTVRSGWNKVRHPRGGGSRRTARRTRR